MTWMRRVTDGVSRLLGGPPSARELGAHRPDFVAEGLSLEKANDLDGALTSYRLALRTNPDDTKILLNMAIVFTKSARTDEAIRTYRKILEAEPTHPGAHYGLAFLLARKGDADGAIEHLETYLAAAPAGAEHARWRSHAQATLRTLRGEPEPALESEGTDGATPVDTPLRQVTASTDYRGLQATGTDGLRHGNDA